jgi:hypothetical protein
VGAYPLLIGGLAELVGLKAAMFVIFVTPGYIFSIGMGQPADC